ncbi:MAG: heavy metal-binding domain-containing protein [Gemmatimonadota bacterium]
MAPPQPAASGKQIQRDPRPDHPRDSSELSLDYFKRIAGSLKGIVGGNIRVYEPLLERARREALIRMKEEARERGHDTIINVRIETSRLASARADGKGTVGVEILAFGTAVTLSEGRPTLPGA